MYSPEETLMNSFLYLKLGRRTRQELLAVQENFIKTFEIAQAKNLYFFQTTDSTFANRNTSTINVELIPTNRIAISDLEVGKVHTGKFVLCRVITKCVKLTALTTVIEDPEGDVERLSAYNYIPVNKIPNAKILSVDQASLFLPIGTILAIQNPYYKVGSQDGATMIRSDNPSEIVILKPDDKLLTQVGWKTGSNSFTNVKTETQNIPSADSFRVRGNEHFGKNDFTSAVDEYLRGIELYPQNVLLYANKAEAHLRLSQFIEALHNTEMALKLDPKHLKAGIRKGKALKHLKRYEESANVFRDLLRNPAIKNSLNVKLKKVIEEYRNQAQMLDSENKYGQYNYIEIIDEFIKKIQVRIGTKEWIYPGGPRLDHADYINNAIEIKHIGDKGRGLVANCDIPQHTLLIVSKAFEIVFDQEVPECLNLNFNRKIMNDAKSTELVTLIVQRLRAEPQLAQEIYQLYAGPTMIPGKDLDEKTLNIIDIERIEKIVYYHQFQAAYPWENFDQKRQEDCFESGIWIMPSYFNHSCVDANVQSIYLGDLMFVRAQRSIRKGEELTLAYFDQSNSYEKRIKLLKHFGIKCQCRLCKFERDEPNRVRQRRINIEKKLCSEIIPRISPRSERFSLSSSVITDLEGMIDELNSLGLTYPELEFLSLRAKDALSMTYFNIHRLTESMGIAHQLHDQMKKRNLFYWAYKFSSLLTLLYMVTRKAEKAKVYFNLALYEMVAPIIGDFDIRNSEQRSKALSIAEKLGMQFIPGEMLAELL
ncbi:6404_t:CDS:1 [Ambispora gerdemannii]|uniref:6404_t:CDS:1 n=1 Tax=Ambispora gerdemannii TaxID=144530 RepID=A0A9N9AK71_9GLOM|nr:6404_t:CDS:1 [Ambispora gerdemannii]